MRLLAVFDYTEPTGGGQSKPEYRGHKAFETSGKDRAFPLRGRKVSRRPAQCQHAGTEADYHPIHEDCMGRSA